MTLRTKKVRDDPAAPTCPKSPQPPRRRRKMQPPLTSMIDVTFQLLLFFLLACEFRESEGALPGALPAGPTDRVAVVTRPSPVRVSVHRSAHGASAYYRLSGSTEMITGPQELFERLRRRQAVLETRDVPLVIDPTGNVPWQFVVEAFNQAQRAEFSKIGFAQDSL